MSDLLRADWPAPARVRGLMTTRAGGVSQGAYRALNLGARVGDNPAAVLENRQRLRTLANLPDEPVWLRQVHGVRVIELPAAPEPEADAGFTTQAGVVCAVQSADCLPVLFCNDEATVVAAAHAGWRGLASGVLEATVRALPVPPQTLMAWMGAAIGPAAFEVGAEVREAFVAADADCAAAFVSHAPGKFMADLFQLARRRLHAAGVDRVYGGGICTYCDATRFFSHRRDATTGRQAALVWLEAR